MFKIYFFASGAKRQKLLTLKRITSGNEGRVASLARYEQARTSAKQPRLN